MATSNELGRRWEIDDLLDLASQGETYLKAVPVLILEHWVQGNRQKGIANLVKTRELADRLVGSGLAAPFKPRDSSIISVLTRMQNNRNLTRPRLVKQSGRGIYLIELPGYEALLEEYRQRYRKEYSASYARLFPVGEPDWGQPSPPEEPVEQEGEELLPRISEEQGQIESALERVRQLFLELTEENRRLRAREREKEKLRGELGQDPTELTDLFVSYSSRYREEGERIAQKAKERNLSVFLDRKIEYGSDFSEEIRRELRGSRELCVLVTPEALNSEWVITEWGAAWVLGKRITPILLRCSEDDLSERLRKYQCVDFHNIEEFLDQVARRKSSSYDHLPSRK